jgi:uncharacterized protein YukE
LGIFLLSRVGPGEAKGQAVGGRYDAMMLQYQNQQGSQGTYTGTVAPGVPQFSPHGYPDPANWSDPSVTGHDLMVHRDQLRDVAKSLGTMASQLQSTLDTFKASANEASVGPAGNWSAAVLLNKGMSLAYQGVGEFVGDLVQAHTDTQARLNGSADNYELAERSSTSAINAVNDPSATRIGAGGQNTAVDPWYGKPTPTAQQAEAYSRLQHIENMPGNGGGQTWNGTFNITADQSFSPGRTSQYSAQEIKAMLDATDPDAITAVGQAYQPVVDHLTTITGQLAKHASTLAENWGGPNAVTAVSQMQQLHQTATDLQANAWSAQAALTWYGPVLATYQQNVPQPTSTASQADTTAANTAAQQHLASLNQHIQTAYYQLPPVVNKNLPPPMAKPAKAATTGGGGSGGGSGGTGGLPGGGTGSVGSPPAGGVPPVGSVPGGPGGGSPGSPIMQPGPIVAPAPTHLAGAGPGGGVSPGGPGLGVPGGGPGSGGGVPGSSGLPGSGSGSGLPGGGFSFPGGPGGSGGSGDPEPGFTGPGEDGLGPGGMGDTGLGDAAVGPAGGAPGDFTGEPGGGLGEGGWGSSTGEGGGPGGFPMGGGGGGGAGGAGRSRQSWEIEDESTWADEGPALGGDGIIGTEIGTDGFPGSGMIADGFPGSGMIGSDFAAEPGLPAGSGMFGAPAGPGGYAASGGPGSDMAAEPGMFAPGGAGAPGGQEKSRSRQAWMDEDHDIWDSSDPSVPPMIG